MSIILKDIDMPEGCWNCRGRHIVGASGALCAFKKGYNEIRVNDMTGFDDNCPLRDDDDLIQYLKEYFKDENGIAIDEYWHHNTVFKAIRQYFGDGKD